MVPEGSAVPSLGTKVENSPQTVLKPPAAPRTPRPRRQVKGLLGSVYYQQPHLARLARGGRAKGLSGQPS